MKLVTYLDQNDAPAVGALVEDRIIDLHATNSSIPNHMRTLLAGGNQVLALVRQAIDSGNAVTAGTLEEIRLLAPVPDPRKVICIGLNYKDHAEESGLKIPTEPVVFNKFPTAVTGHNSPILLPPTSSEVDYEAELVIVIGKPGRDIAKSQAMEHVAGYTAGHDVSARDWQIKKDGKQWLMGKSFDTFAPMGPALVTADEVPNPHNLAIHFRLNGETMQDSTTGQMIFRVEELVAYVSQVCTLETGDVIFTGTPPGVGFARKPPVFLKPGDTCEVEIEKLGVLRNQCVAR